MDAVRHIARTISVALVALAISVRPAHTQSLRPLTPEEHAAMEKFVGVLVPLLDRFGDENWKKKGDFFSGIENVGAARHPTVPLDVAENWERTYEVPENSPRFKTLLMPIIDRLQVLSKDLMNPAVAPEIQKLTKEYHALASVIVHVQINRQSLQAAWAQVGTPSLPIDGAAVAHKVATKDCPGGDVGSCYVMAFGNWAGAIARTGTSGKYLQFYFANAPATPHIENVVIYIRGADDRIQDLLKLEWKRLNDGLS